VVFTYLVKPASGVASVETFVRVVFAACVAGNGISSDCRREAGANHIQWSMHEFHKVVGGNRASGEMPILCI